ncbi:hypothetical protein D3C71_1273380 [compost metagenome]
MCRSLAGTVGGQCWQVDEAQKAQDRHQGATGLRGQQWTKHQTHMQQTEVIDVHFTARTPAITVREQLAVSLDAGTVDDGRDIPTLQTCCKGLNAGHLGQVDELRLHIRQSGFAGSGLVRGNDHGVDPLRHQLRHEGRTYAAGTPNEQNIGLGECS